MLKNVKWFFVVLVFSSFISLSFDKRKTPTEKLPLGAQAPELVLGKEKQPLSLQAAKGQLHSAEFLGQLRRRIAYTQCQTAQCGFGRRPC